MGLSLPFWGGETKAWNIQQLVQDHPKEGSALNKVMYTRTWHRRSYPVPSLYLGEGFCRVRESWPSHRIVKKGDDRVFTLGVGNRKSSSLSVRKRGRNPAEPS